MELVSRPHARNLVTWAQHRPEVVVLSADLTASCEADAFRTAYPNRFFSMGMAEQNMLSMAGGLAREGFTPFIHTFSVFICRRAFDQLTMSIAYPNLPVRLLGFLPGITTPGGVTHQAIDDIALMRVVPNMTILECGDATDVETILDLAQAIDGPVYLRMLRGEVPRLFAPDEPIRLGTPRRLSDGDDLLVVSSGICTEEVLRATKALQSRGVGLRHVHVSTHKPWNDTALLDACKGIRHGVISVENHSVIGGLGSAIAETMAQAGLGLPLRRLGLQDCYAHGASRAYLMAKYGFDAQAVITTAEQLLGRSLEIQGSELSAVRLQPMHSLDKAEAL
ncbi:MAG: transketolase C-terminal domain-containing protein [Myxococcota bacterium]|jgi:transketolase|nr:transketolase C-terminal domain-containing protein [Myxococcota bacterium]